MKLSIILPVKNEAKGIIQTLDLIIKELQKINYEIVVINDYSDDDSYRIIEEKSKNEKEIKLFNNYKKGLGGAINMGIEKSTGEVICIMMSDLSDDISDLKKYYSLIQTENIDAVLDHDLLTDLKL